MQGRDGKYHYKGKAYDTLKEMSEAEWRDMERTRLKNIDELNALGIGSKGLDEDELRRKVREWDEKGI